MAAIASREMSSASSTGRSRSRDDVVAPDAPPAAVAAAPLATAALPPLASPERSPRIRSHTSTACSALMPSTPRSLANPSLVSWRGDT